MSGKTGRGDRGPSRLASALSGLAVALGCVLFLGGFAWGAVLYRPYTVPTDSMSPTVAAGDRVLAQRIDGTDVRRGDVVVFNDPNWGDLPMVKRVVGVGGDTVACCGADGRLTINGKPVDEPYLRAGEAASLTEFSAAVPEGRLFLLGDERNGSQDSRVHLQDASHGSVPRSAVTARVDAVAWPLGSMVERPQEFAALPGGISEPGPVKPVVAAVAVGAVLVLAGAAGPSLARALSGGGRGADRKRPARGKAPADA